jgi:hypothetical protein
MEKNIEKLTKLNKISLRNQLANGVRNIRLTLDELDHNINTGGNKAVLISFNNLYKIWVDRFYNEYGFKFPELQKQYDELVPKINEYLEVKK